MGVFGAVFGCRGDAGFSGLLLGASRGVVGFNVAMFLRPVREVFRHARSKHSDFGVFALAGRVFSRNCGCRGRVGRVFRGTAVDRGMLREFFSELPPEGPCWASLFVDQQSLDPAGRGVLAAVRASGPFYWLQCASEPT